MEHKFIFVEADDPTLEDDYYQHVDHLEWHIQVSGRLYSVARFKDECLTEFGLHKSLPDAMLEADMLANNPILADVQCADNLGALAGMVNNWLKEEGLPIMKWDEIPINDLCRVQEAVLNAAIRRWNWLSFHLKQRNMIDGKPREKPENEKSA